MGDNLEIGLARRIEAGAIAGLSREIVEHGFREVELVRGYYFSVENAVRVELLLA